jgi:hypothetical protein
VEQESSGAVMEARPSSGLGSGEAADRRGRMRLGAKKNERGAEKKRKKRGEKRRRKEEEGEGEERR